MNRRCTIVDTSMSTRAGGSAVIRSRSTVWAVALPRLLDSVVAIVACVPGILAALLTGTGYWPITVGAACVSAIVLLFRRTQPIGVLIAVSLLALVGYSPQLVLAVAVAVFTVAAQSSARVAIGGYLFPVVLAMVGAAAKTALGVVGPIVTPSVPTALGSTLVEPLLVIALATGLVVKSRRLRREASNELIEQRIENARVTERSRITAEMHDVVGHSLTVMIALANGASMGWQKDPAQSAIALRHLSQVGADALTDMQRTLRMLRDSDIELDDVLHHSGHDVPPVEQLIEVFRVAGLPVTFAHHGLSLPDDTILRLTIYRITQEALTNALRYAVSPTEVELTITHDPGMVRITAIDDGQGSGRKSIGAGRGLIGISERAAYFGGMSVAGPRPLGGWETTATLFTGDGDD